MSETPDPAADERGRVSWPDLWHGELNRLVGLAIGSNRDRRIAAARGPDGAKS